MNLEIQNILEHSFGVAFPIKEVGALTFHRLGEISSSNDKDCYTQTTTDKETKSEPEKNSAIESHHLLVPMKDMVKMKSMSNNSNKAPVFFIPSIHGDVARLEKVAAHVQNDVYGFQYTTSVPTDSWSSVASHYIQVFD